ncbi:MAG: hypothetical protein RR092_05950, partial [Oscillospiraceae bacterium]
EPIYMYRQGAFFDWKASRGGWDPPLRQFCKVLSYLAMQSSKGADIIRPFVYVPINGTALSKLS